MFSEKLNFNNSIVTEFDLHYENVHAVNIPSLISRSRFNAFIGIFHDASVKAYYRIATMIEKTARDFDLCSNSSVRSTKILDDLSAIHNSRYGKIWVID